MDRRVIPPKRVTSPTWGPPPPCKQALIWSPHLSCKRDEIKMRDYMDRRVIPPKRVTHLPGVPHLRVNRPLKIKITMHILPFSWLAITGSDPLRFPPLYKNRPDFS